MQIFTGYGLINEHKQLVFSEMGRYARDYCEIVQTQHPFCEQPDCRGTTLVYWVQAPGKPTIVKELSND